MRKRARVSSARPLRMFGRGKATISRNTPELKYCDLDSTGDVTLAGLILGMNAGIDQGTAVDERIGTRVRNVYAHAKLLLAPKIQASTYNEPIHIRCLMVFDAAPNGATPTLGTILANTTGTADYASHPNPVNKSRFKILRQKIVSFGPNLTDAASQFTYGYEHAPVWVEMHSRVPYETEFIATGSGVANLGRGAIWLCVFGSQATTATYKYETRVAYHDL